MRVISTALLCSLIIVSALGGKLRSRDEIHQSMMEMTGSMGTMSGSSGIAAFFEYYFQALFAADGLANCTNNPGTEYLSESCQVSLMEAYFGAFSGGSSSGSMHGVSGSSSPSYMTGTSGSGMNGVSNSVSTSPFGVNGKTAIKAICEDSTCWSSIKKWISDIESSTENGFACLETVGLIDYEMWMIANTADCTMDTLSNSTIFDSAYANYLSTGKFSFSASQCSAISCCEYQLIDYIDALLTYDAAFSSEVGTSMNDVYGQLKSDCATEAAMCPDVCVVVTSGSSLAVMSLLGSFVIGVLSLFI